jgi:hypothetical protein
MSRSLPAECGPDWLMMMRRWTLQFAVGQARSVIAQYRDKPTLHIASDYDILRDFYKEWPEGFIREVVAEMHIQDTA